MNRNLKDSFKLFEIFILFGDWDIFGDVPREGMSLYDEEADVVAGGEAGLHVEQEDEIGIKLELEFADLIIWGLVFQINCGILLWRTVFDIVM